MQALQERWNLLRQVIAERADHFRAGGDDEYDKAIPSGTTGLLVKDFKGKDADRPVYKIDTAALAELRAHEKQAAEELEPWKTHVEERKVIDASQAAIKPAARHGRACSSIPAIASPSDRRPRIDGVIGC